MITLRASIGPLVTLATLWGCCQMVVGQAISELPRSEYYVARELFRVGRTVEATEGFKAALTRASRTGDRRWIDSLPPLVMLGECYYQQGQVAAALEQYDAALMLAISNAGWIDQVELRVEQLPDLEISHKGINWFPKSRPTRTVGVPAGIQVSLDPTQSQITPQGEVVAPVSLITQLDVTEVLKTMGIALVRRWEVLGPLGKHSPLAEPLNQLFARNPLQQVPWVITSWSVLRGIHSLSSGSGLDGSQLIRQGTMIGNQLHYYLTPLALLSLGKLDARQGNYQAGIVNFQDAALVAAEFEQYAELAEAVGELSACAAASGRTDLLDSLQQLALWANNKSGRVQVTALVGAAELSVYGENVGQSDRLLKQSMTVLRGREPSLPRLQAQLAYITAMLAFRQNKQAAGLTNLNAALKIMQGSVTTGAVVESVFQAQLTLDLLASKALTALDAEQVLNATLTEPSRTDWELSPLKTLAAITTSRLPAYEHWLQLAVARGADEPLIFELMDQLQRKRFYEALPLGGRLFAWRQAIAGDVQRLPPEERRMVEATLQRFSELKSTNDRIGQLIEQLRQAPLPLDERKLSGDTKRAYTELVELSGQLESQLAFHAIRRNALQRHFPPTANLDQAQTSLSPGDLALGLVVAGECIYGVALADNASTFWQVPDKAFLDANLRALLTEIGLVPTTPPRLPSQISSPAADWQKSAELLASSLFPDTVLEMLDRARRLIIIPNGRLWYVPYELLPTRPIAGSERWIARRSITYAPTLGSTNVAYASSPKIQDTVGIVGGKYFSLTPENNASYAQSLVASVPGTQIVSLSQRISAPSSRWLRLRTDQMWIANAVEVGSSGWEAVPLPFSPSRQEQVGTWLETPRRSPAVLLMPGLKTGLQHGNIADGNEIFLPICSLLFSGTKSVLISRWSVGGGSTSRIMQRYLEELQEERPSNALRRAILASWTEQYLVANEPALLPAGKEASAIISGMHPLLWSGYMAVGDYRQTP